jgi:hypothetical protein
MRQDEGPSSLSNRLVLRHRRQLALIDPWSPRRLLQHRPQHVAVQILLVFAPFPSFRKSIRSLGACVFSCHDKLMELSGRQIAIQ